MASKELRINTGDSSTSSDSSSSDDEQQDTSTEEEMQEEPQDVSMEEVSPKSMPPKMRIKLSLRKSPPSNSTATENQKEDTMHVKHVAPITEKASKNVAMEDTDDGVAEATIVNTEEEGAAIVEVEAKVIETTKPPAAKSRLPPPPKRISLPPPPRNQSRGKELPKPPVAATKKKRAFSKPMLPTNNTARTVRLPPLTSPGMLLPPSASTFRGDADANGNTIPASVFDYCMNMAGYTIKARTEDPHRGSSVCRQVGDMFDSDVSFAVNFPPLVPKEAWSLSKMENEEKKVEAGTENGQEMLTDTTDQAEKQVKEEPKRDAAQILLRALDPAKGQIQTDESTDSSSCRKRRRPWQFSEMVPRSLTIPYPESYIQKRVRYAEKVKEREHAIIVNQEANQKFEDDKDRYNLFSSAKRHTEELPSPPARPVPIAVPPIPEPVTPPRISELDGEEFKDIDDSKHPIYLPKEHENLTAHLDPACFDITNGRYFGAYSNTIADPNFVGPNAPGISGLNFAGGSGLATAYTGSTSGGATSFLASVSANSGTASGATKQSFSGKSTSKKNKASSNTAQVFSKPAVPETLSAGQDDATATDGPAPTSTSTALKRLIDEGDDDALKMKAVIVRAAVYAARAGMHTMSFVGSNGEIYPDVSKAFAAHGGVRPCIKCKNNKQGAYHCRLRRKHEALDYDGGDSPSALAPLFKEPLADLLLTITIHGQ